VKIHTTLLIPIKSIPLKSEEKAKLVGGALVGAASGAVLGLSIGFLDGDDEPGLLSYSKEVKASIFAIFLSPIGSGIGALIGTKRERIQINGSTDTYVAQLSVIRGYSLE
jgi:hypothetical protein